MRKSARKSGWVSRSAETARNLGRDSGHLKTNEWIRGEGVHPVGVFANFGVPHGGHFLESPRFEKTGWKSGIWRRSQRIHARIRRTSGHRESNEFVALLFGFSAF